MAKKVTGFIKLQIPGGQANPSPPIGPALGQRGVNIMEFCKAFNAKTNKEMGVVLPTIITVYSDRSFSFITKTPPTTYLVKDKSKIKTGAHKPGHEVAGTISEKIVEDVAKHKMPDLSAATIGAAKKTVEGSVRSMGIKLDYK